MVTQTKWSVLIIDDSSIGRIAVKQAFKQSDVQLEELESAEPFFRYPNQYQDLDLLILDISLPGMDGLTALEKLRADERWTGLPVIVVTSRADPETVRRALHAHANDYIVKPFDNEVLLAKVQRVLEQKRQDWPDPETVFQVGNELKRAERGKTPFALLGVKIRNEKDNLSDPWHINKLREDIRLRLREIDTVYFNGCYLLLLLPFTDSAGAEIVAGKIRGLLFQEIELEIVAYPAHGRNALQLLNTLKQRLDREDSPVDLQLPE